jgi:peptide deformylase
MKNLSDLVLLGDPRLYEPCDPILSEDRAFIKEWVTDLHNVMNEVRKKFQFGRAIAAPQIGIMKRLIYLNIDNNPIVIINPKIISKSDEMIELWDDCMSFPNLLVKVKRHKQIHIHYLNEDWEAQLWTIENDLSELIQHEYDHLDGILCTMRAVDQQAFKWIHRGYK